MSITIKQLRNVKHIEKVILHCHDQSLYLVSVVVDGKEDYVKDDNGEFLKSFNKLELQTKFSEFDVKQMLLQHQSPYDEMIGLSEQPVDNTLEVSLGGEGYAVSRI